MIHVHAQRRASGPEAASEVSSAIISIFRIRSPPFLVIFPLMYSETDQPVSLLHVSRWSVPLRAWPPELNVM